LQRGPDRARPGAVGKDQPEVGNDECREAQCRGVSLAFLADGSTLWKQSVLSGKPKFPIHPSNSWATETPVADENGLYAYCGATGTVAGMSHDGSTRWTADVGVIKTSNGFGAGSSLAIHEGKVLVQNLSEQSATITCFDTTGRLNYRKKILFRPGP